MTSNGKPMGFIADDERNEAFVSQQSNPDAHSSADERGLLSVQEGFAVPQVSNSVTLHKNKVSEGIIIGNRCLYPSSYRECAILHFLRCL